MNRNDKPITFQKRVFKNICLIISLKVSSNIEEEVLMFSIKCQDV